MYELLKYTAWTMDKIKPYEMEHLSFFIVGLLLSIFISYKLRNIEIKKLNNIILGVGVTLLIFEIYKQLFYTFYIGGGHYQYWIFPFQLCSIPMYFCLIMPFIKKESIYKYFATFLVSYNLFGGFIAFLEPSGLIHEYITLTIHAFVWHMLIVFVGLLIGLNKNVHFNKKDYLKSIIMFLILCVIAFSINLLFWNVSSHDINMFFIGPGISPLIVFKTIATKYGWFINSIIYIIGISFVSYVIFLLFCKKETIVKKR